MFCGFAIGSDMPSSHFRVDQLQQIFRYNDYPVTLIDQCVKTILNKIFVPLIARYVKSPTLSGCHPHFETLTRMKISTSFHPHYQCFTRITDVSPAFCNCQVKKHPPHQKKTQKNKNKVLFKDKKAPGKPLCISEA